MVRRGTDEFRSNCGRMCSSVLLLRVFDDGVIRVDLLPASSLFIYHSSFIIHHSLLGSSFSGTSSELGSGVGNEKFTINSGRSATVPHSLARKNAPSELFGCPLISSNM